MKIYSYKWALAIISWLHKIFDFCSKFLGFILTWQMKPHTKWYLTIWSFFMEDSFFSIRFLLQQGVYYFLFLLIWNWKKYWQIFLRGWHFRWKSKAVYRGHSFGCSDTSALSLKYWIAREVIRYNWRLSKTFSSFMRILKLSD